MIEYKVVITDEQQKALEHDVIDIKDWIDKAIQGKIDACIKRAANECRQILKTDPTAMLPANDEVAAMALFSAKQYLNRGQREEALKNLTPTETE